MKVAARRLLILSSGILALLLGIVNLPAPPRPGGPGGPGGRPGGPGGGGGLPIENINPAGQAQSEINSQLQQLTRSFNSNDRNRDGQMNQSEFSKMFRSGAFSGIQNRIPSPPGGNQGMASQIFQQLSGNPGSFNLNQLLGFASKMLGGAGSPAGQPKGKMPFRPPSFAKPPIRLPSFLPFGNTTTNNTSRNSSTTNTTTSGSGGSREMSLGYAMTEGRIRDSRIRQQRLSGAGVKSPTEGVAYEQGAGSRHQTRPEEWSRADANSEILHSRQSEWI